MSSRKRHNSNPEHHQTLDKPPGATLLATPPDAAFPNKRDLLEQAEIRNAPNTPDETILENELAAAVKPSTTSAGEWQTRFAARRPKMGPVQIVEDPATVKSLMDAWPLFDAEMTAQGKIAEFKNAKALKGSLRESKEPSSIELFQNLTNLLEQSERQAIIKEALADPEILDGREVLGLVDQDSRRLEAVCLCKKVTHVSNSGQTRGDRDANHWDATWTSVLYVSELTSAPWNVGWPTTQEGVSRAGTELVAALRKKAEEEECDGIGLAGLLSNVGFYLKAGFRFKDGYSIEQGGFPPFVMETHTQVS